MSLYRHAYLPLLLAAMLVACVAKAAPPAPAEASPADTVMKVELLEAGAEPQEVVRFKPAKDSKQVSVMTMDMQQKMSMNGVALPAPKLPAQKITIAFEVSDVAENGDAKVEYEYTDVTIVRDDTTVDAIANQIEQLMKPMAGTTGSLVLSDRGFPRDAEVTIPPGVAPQLRAMVDGMRQSMDRLGVPLPEEPIGVGAKWRMAAQVTANGVTIDQTTTYELLSVSEGVYSVGIEIEQEAEQQNVKPPGLPPNAVVTLKSLDSTGAGKLELVADSVVPRLSEITLNSVTDMEIAAGGNKQAMSVDLTMKMSLAPQAEGVPASE